MLFTKEIEEDLQKLQEDLQKPQGKYITEFAKKYFTELEFDHHRGLIYREIFNINILKSRLDSFEPSLLSTMPLIYHVLNRYALTLRISEIISKIEKLEASRSSGLYGTIVKDRKGFYWINGYYSVDDIFEEMLEEIIDSDQAIKNLQNLALFLIRMSMNYSSIISEILNYTQKKKEADRRWIKWIIRH